MGKKTVCSKCNMTFERAVLLAIFIELGARTSSDPSTCIDGKAHDWQGAPTFPVGVDTGPLVK